MAYKTITTAEPGWFFVQTDHAQIKKNNQEHPIIFRIAAWGLNEDGTVVGLLGVAAHNGSGNPSGSQTSLHEPNPLANGEYKHYNDLTHAELAALDDPTRPNRQNI